MLLKNATIVNSRFTLSKEDIRIVDDKICQIGDLQPENGEIVLDLRGHYILPGLIDTHIHGAYQEGIDCSDVDGLLRMARFEATQGVTSFAITSASPKSFDLLLQQLQVAAEAVAISKAGLTDGAKIVAIHAEGPFLSTRRPGAMEPERFQVPSQALLDEMRAICGEDLKILTVAPENPGACDFIRYAADQGITVSLGHSVATYEEAMAGIQAGATQATHTFNGMPSYHHREPGILGAALLSDKVKCEMICDYVHLHPATVQLIYRLKGADQINMISDSVDIAGTTETELDFDGVKATVKNGVILRADGVIAGSAMTLLHGVQNLLRDGYPMGDVAKMASGNPAKTLGIAQITGSIAEGKLADLVILDQNYSVVYTFMNGKCVFAANEKEQTL